MNLSKYITNGLFVRNLVANSPIKHIIFEKFDNYEIAKEAKKNGITIQTLKEIGFTNLKKYSTEKEKILLIVDKLGINDIIPYLGTSNITIVETYAGITSKAKKFNIAHDDITLALKHKLQCKEPYDLGSFMDAIENTKSSYIRIYDKEYPGSLLGDQKSNTGLINLSALGYAGTEGTILCAGAYAGEIAMTHSYLDEENSYNLFIINDYMFKRVPALEESIRQNKTCIIIIDQQKNSSYIEELVEELVQRKIKKNNIHVITPDYEKISSNITEYMQEQSGFDGIGLFNNITLTTKN